MSEWSKELPTELGFYWIRSLKTNRISLLRLGKNNWNQFIWEPVGFNIEMLHQFYDYRNCEFMRIECPLPGYYFNHKAGEFYLEGDNE